MFIFILALCILWIGSLSWLAIACPSNKPAWLMGLYLLVSANITLSSYIANSFYLLNQRWAMLGLHMLIGGLGWLVWKRIGKPTLWLPFQNWKIKFDIQWLKREPVLALFMSSLTVSYIFALAQVILIPQNNMDSLSTHLSRIGFWLQHGSFFPWQTTTPDQVWYPVVAQLQTYWTLLFLGNDRMVGIVQWLAALISGVGVYGLGRLFDYQQRASAFAALIFMSFPLVALQATTTQTDLVTVAFFIPAVYFLILGMRDGQYSLLSLSAMSVGMGVGVKKSYFILLPILGMIVLLLILQFGKRIWKPLLFWSVNLLVAVALLGSYIYISNWKNFGDMFGSPNYIENMIETPQTQNQAPVVKPVIARIARHGTALDSMRQNPSIGSDILLEVLYNAPRLFYQALDTSGLPRPLDGYAHKVKMRVAQNFFKTIGFEEIEGKAYAAPGHIFSFSQKNINEESNAWYGPLSIFLILPALLIQSWRGVRLRSWLLLIPAMAILIFVPLEIILRPGWDPYQGRYFAPLVALCAPVMAIWFKAKNNSIFEWVISIFSVIILIVTLLYNPSKPTFGKYADELHVWNNSRIFIQTIQRNKDRDLYVMVEENVPADATLGYYAPFFILDYPLFGEPLTRRLVPLTVASQIFDLQWLRAQRIEYLLIPQAGGYPAPPIDYQIVTHVNGWKLYVYVPTQ